VDVPRGREAPRHRKRDLRGAVHMPDSLPGRVKIVGEGMGERRGRIYAVIVSTYANNHMTFHSATRVSTHYT
jgi:hypothetical protein